MHKKQNDLLKYTANIIGVSAIAYFAAARLFSLFFSLILTFFHNGATLQNPIGVPEWVMGCANLTVSQGSLVFAIVVLRALCSKNNLPQILLTLPKRNSDWLFVPAFLGAGILANIINHITATVGRVAVGYTQSPSLILPKGGVGIFLYFLALCVAPAVLEEIFVRGHIQGLLARWGPWFSIIVSSVLFTLLHPDITQMPGIFLLSVLLGLVAYVTKSLLPSIILHFANNCVAFLLSLAQQNADSAMLNAFSAYIIIMLVVAAVLSIGAICKGKFYCGFEPIPRIKDPKNRQSRFERLLTSPCFIVVMLALTMRAFTGLI